MDDTLNVLHVYCDTSDEKERKLLWRFSRTQNDPSTFYLHLYNLAED